MPSESSLFAIIADSACDLSRDYLRGHGVGYVPMHVRMGGSDLLDLVDVDTSDFYVKMATTKEEPRTSCPSPAEYDAELRRAVDEGFRSVVILTASSGLSGAHASALVAAQGAPEGVRVEVIDTRLVSAAEGIVVDAVVQARDAGKDIDEAIAVARETIESTQFLFVPSSFLSVSNGRAHPVRGILSHMLGTRPLLICGPDGRLTEHARSSDLSDLTGRIARIMSRFSAEHGALAYVEVSAGVQRRLTMLEKPLRTNEFSSRKVGVASACPSVVAHSGVGTIGIAYVPERLWSNEEAFPQTSQGE